MKIIIEPKDHESVLAQWRGAHAKIWIFHVSLKRMAIMLFQENAPEVIYIVAVTCEHISGPFSWKQADVSIITEPPDQFGKFRQRVIDRKAGFDLLCSSVAIARGPAGVPENPFENFLGEA